MYNILPFINAKLRLSEHNTKRNASFFIFIAEHNNQASRVCMHLRQANGTAAKQHTSHPRERSDSLRSGGVTQSAAPE